MPDLQNQRNDHHPNSNQGVSQASPAKSDFFKRGVDASLPREQRKKLNYQMLMRSYYRVLAGVDENVGRILEFLDKNGLAENTLVFPKFGSG